MTDLSGYDATKYEPTIGYEPVKPGDYTAIAVETETKPTKKGNGSYLQFTFEIIDEEEKGRILWARLNLDNPSQAAVDIARAELSAICHAVGVLQPKDSIELHNIPLVIKVICKKRKDTGQIVNEIAGYSKKSSSQAAARDEGGSEVPPWQRG